MMEKNGNMKYYTHEEMLDAVIGKRGTPRREEHEAAIDAFLITMSRAFRVLGVEVSLEVAGIGKVALLR